MSSQQNSRRTGWQLFKYYFNFNQRSLEKLKLEQVNLESKSYVDLQAEYTLAKRKTEFATKVYNTLKGVNIIAVVVFIVGLTSQVATSYYTKNITKYHPSSDQIIFAEELVVVTLIIVVIILVLILIFAAHSVNSKQSRMEMIKPVLESKKVQHDAERNDKNKILHDLEHPMRGAINER